MTPAGDQALLSLRGVEVGYGQALWPALDLQICAGQLWALIGRNGSGKSTLIRSLLKVQAPLSGKIDFSNGVRVAYVPQRGDYDLSVPGRVIDFVRGGADRGWSFLRPGYVRACAQDVQDALLKTSTESLQRQPMHTLSEGQKQRVLIARALVARPSLLVLDEPTSAMDVIAERGVFDLLEHLRAEHNLAVLMASHQLRFVPEYATHALMLDADNRTRLGGPAKEVLSSSEFVAAWGRVLS